MAKLKKFNQLLEDKKAKEELEKYDIYTMNDETLKRVKRAERRKNYTLITNVDKFYDRFKQCMGK